MDKIIKSIKILIFIAIILFFLIIYKLNLSYTPFESDEVVYPCMSDIYQLVKQKSWSSEKWKKSKWNFTTSPISRYLYGIYIDVTNQAQYYSVMDCSHYNKYLRKSMSFLTPTQQAYLLNLRLFNIYIALIVLTISFITFWKIFNPFLAIIGIFMLGLNPLFRLYATRSMAEMPFMLFISLGLFLLWQIQKSLRHPKKSIVLNILFGICSGLVIMTKPYGIIIYVTWIFLLLLNRLEIKKLLSIFIIGTSTCLLAMIAVYPPFFTNPFSVIDWFTSWIEIQGEFRIRYLFNVLSTPIDRLNSLIVNFIFPGKMTVFNKMPLINLFLIALGIFALIVKYFGNKRCLNNELFILSCLIAFLLCPLFYLQLNFDRYYLPFFFPIIFIFLYSLKIIFNKVSQFL